jgi:hypothetical protein
MALNYLNEYVRPAFRDAISISRLTNSTVLAQAANQPRGFDHAVAETADEKRAVSTKGGSSAGRERLGGLLKYYEREAA